MAVAIWTNGYDDGLSVNETDATLEQVRRYCKYKHDELIAYSSGDIQVFTEYYLGKISADEMATEISKDIAERRQRRRDNRRERQRWDALTPEQKEAELKAKREAMTPLQLMDEMLKETFYGVIVQQLNEDTPFISLMKLAPE